MLLTRTETRAVRGLTDLFCHPRYGGSCYLKTAKLPLVNQTPPKGVALVACIKNQSLDHDADTSEKQTAGAVASAKLVANVTVYGMGCGWRTDLPKPGGDSAPLKSDDAVKLCVLPPTRHLNYTQGCAAHANITAMNVSWAAQRAPSRLGSSFTT